MLLNNYLIIFFIKKLTKKLKLFFLIFILKKIAFVSFICILVENFFYILHSQVLLFSGIIMKKYIIFINK